MYNGDAESMTAIKWIGHARVNEFNYKIQWFIFFLDSVEHMKTSFINLMITLSSDASKDKVCLTPIGSNWGVPHSKFSHTPAPIEENLIRSTDTLSPPPNEEHL